MSSAIQLSRVATLVSTCAAAASLLFLAMQRRKANRLAFLAAHNTLTERVMSIDLLIFEHPELKPFLRGGALIEPLSTEEQDRILAILEYVADVLENAQIHRRYLGRKAIVWEPYLQCFLQNSPELCEFICGHEDWYEKEVPAFVSKTLSPIRKRRFFAP